MRFREFAGRIQEKVGILCGEGYRLKIESIRKNNGMVCRGMSIQKKGEDSGPVIYLDSYYEYYKKGVMSLETAAEEIYKVFVRRETPAELREMLKDFKKIRNRVVCRLVNRERNKALLEDIPWIPFCDLAMVFSVLLSEGREGCLSSLIHHRHVKMWHTSVEELCRLARGNILKLQPYVFRSMSEVIKESIGMSAVDGEETDLEAEGMYVLSNKSGIYGAAAMLYNNVLRDISERLEADLIILPSSVHEVIIIPYEEELSLEGLGEMVKVINQTEVPKEDWLSDNVYRYSRETGMVTVAFKTMAE